MKEEIDNIKKFVPRTKKRLKKCFRIQEVVTRADRDGDLEVVVNLVAGTFDTKKSAKRYILEELLPNRYYHIVKLYKP